MPLKDFKVRRALSGLLADRSITQRRLAATLIVLFFISLVPLYVAALYNYPADDDFTFIYPVAQAWTSTHSLFAVCRAIGENVRDMYLTWNGYFAHFVFISASPMIFNIKLYFLSNWFALTAICLSVGYVLKPLTVGIFKASKPAFWIAYTAVMLLRLQFIPSISEAAYWNSGATYVFTGCMVLFALGLLVKCAMPQSRVQSVYRMALLALCGIYIGGGVLPAALGALLLFSFITLYALIKKLRFRWHSLILLCFYAAAFAVSITAPGNALRQEWFGETHSVSFTVLTAILDSCDFAGNWFSLRLAAMLMLILPVLWNPMRKSPYRFRHPVLVFVILFGAYSATLVPGIYTTFGYDSPRYFNVVYMFFLLFALSGILYAQGALIRLLERKQESRTVKLFLESTENLGQRFSVIYLLVCVVVLAFGGFANTIMNTSSVSAAKTLLSGEAATFRQEMSERQEYIRITDSDVVAVTRLSVRPYIFKEDKLPFQGIYGPVRYMKWYFELFQEPEQAQEDTSAAPVSRLPANGAAAIGV